MRITIDMPDEYNFHNQPPISINVPGLSQEQIDKWREEHPNKGFEVEITESQANRISNHFCGIKDCMCYSDPVYEIGYNRWVVYI